MLDKFQKLFGPNPPRTAAAPAQAPLDDLDLAGEDEEHRRRIARVKNKRRLLGLAAIVAAVAAPAVFEPNDMYAARGAKLEIPSLQDETAAKVVPLNRKVDQTKAIPTDIATADLPAEKSLRSANPVAAEAKPITTAEQKTAPVKTAAAPAKASPAAKENKDQKDAKDAGESAAGTLQAVSNGSYFIQVIATSKKEAAEKVAADLRKLGLPSYTEIVRRRVRVGRFAAEADARRALDILALNAVSNGGINTEKAK